MRLCLVLVVSAFAWCNEALGAHRGRKQLDSMDFVTHIHKYTDSDTMPVLVLSITQPVLNGRTGVVKKAAANSVSPIPNPPTVDNDKIMSPPERHQPASAEAKPLKKRKSVFPNQHRLIAKKMKVASFQRSQLMWKSKAATGAEIEHTTEMLSTIASPKPTTMSPDSQEALTMQSTNQQSMLLPTTATDIASGALKTSIVEDVTEKLVARWPPDPSIYPGVLQLMTFKNLKEIKPSEYPNQDGIQNENNLKRPLSSANFSLPFDMKPTSRPSRKESHSSSSTRIDKKEKKPSKHHSSSHRHGSKKRRHHDNHRGSHHKPSHGTRSSEQPEQVEQKQKLHSPQANPHRVTATIFDLDRPDDFDTQPSADYIEAGEQTPQDQNQIYGALGAFDHMQIDEDVDHYPHDTNDQRPVLQEPNDDHNVVHIRPRPEQFVYQFNLENNRPFREEVHSSQRPLNQRPILVGTNNQDSIGIGLITNEVDGNHHHQQQGGNHDQQGDRDEQDNDDFEHDHPGDDFHNFDSNHDVDHLVEHDDLPDDHRFSGERPNLDNNHHDDREDHIHHSNEALHQDLESHNDDIDHFSHELITDNDHQSENDDFDDHAHNHHSTEHHRPHHQNSQENFHHGDDNQDDHDDQYDLQLSSENHQQSPHRPEGNMGFHGENSNTNQHPQHSAEDDHRPASWPAPGNRPTSGELITDQQHQTQDGNDDEHDRPTEEDNLDDFEDDGDYPTNEADDALYPDNDNQQPNSIEMSQRPVGNPLSGQNSREKPQPEEIDPNVAPLSEEETGNSQAQVMPSIATNLPIPPSISQSSVVPIVQPATVTPVYSPIDPYEDDDEEDDDEEEDDFDDYRDDVVEAGGEGDIGEDDIAEDDVENDDNYDDTAPSASGYFFSGPPSSEELPSAYGYDSGYEESMPSSYSTPSVPDNINDDDYEERTVGISKRRLRSKLKKRKRFSCRTSSW